MWRRTLHKHACTDQRLDKKGVLLCEDDVMEAVHYLSVGAETCLSHEAVEKNERKLSIPEDASDMKRSKPLSQ